MRALERRASSPAYRCRPRGPSSTVPGKVKIFGIQLCLLRLRAARGRSPIVIPATPVGKGWVCWPASPPAMDDDRGVAYDDDLANRIRELIGGEPDLSEQSMFGGLAFLVAGNMSVAASGQGGLIVRVDSDETDVLLAKPYAQPFEMRGRAIQGWLRIDAEGVRTKRQLEPWVRRGLTYARSLPPKRSLA